jgi:hypothetical protein
MKGRYLYIPKEMLEELEDIQFNCKIPSKSEAMRLIAHNCRMAREIKINLGFKYKRGKRG